MRHFTRTTKRGNESNMGNDKRDCESNMGMDNRRVNEEEVKTAVEKAAKLIARWLAQELENINLEEQKKEVK